MSSHNSSANKNLTKNPPFPPSPFGSRTSWGEERGRRAGEETPVITHQIGKKRLLSTFSPLPSYTPDCVRVRSATAKTDSRIGSHMLHSASIALTRTHPSRPHFRPLRHPDGLGRFRNQRAQVPYSQRFDRLLAGWAPKYAGRCALASGVLDKPRRAPRDRSRSPGLAAATALVRTPAECLNKNKRSPPKLPIGTVFASSNLSFLSPGGRVKSQSWVCSDSFRAHGRGESRKEVPGRRSGFLVCNSGTMHGMDRFLPWWWWRRSSEPSPPTNPKQLPHPQQSGKRPTACSRGGQGEGLKQQQRLAFFTSATSRSKGVYFW